MLRALLLALASACPANDHFPLEPGMGWTYCAYHVHPASPDETAFDEKGLRRVVVASARRGRHRLAVVRESEHVQKGSGQSCLASGPGRPVSEHFYLIGPDAVALWGVFKSSSPAALREARAGRLRAFRKLPDSDLASGVRRRAVLPERLEKGARWRSEELELEADRLERVGGSFGAPSRPSLRVSAQSRGRWSGARWYSPGIGLVLSLEPEGDGQGALKALELVER